SGSRRRESRVVDGTPGCVRLRRLGTGCLLWLLLHAGTACATQVQPVKTVFKSARGLGTYDIIYPRLIGLSDPEVQHKINLFLKEQFRHQDLGENLDPGGAPFELKARYQVHLLNDNVAS